MPSTMTAPPGKGKGKPEHTTQMDVGAGTAAQVEAISTSPPMQQHSVVAATTGHTPRYNALLFPHERPAKRPKLARRQSRKTRKSVTFDIARRFHAFLEFWAGRDSELPETIISLILQDPCVVGKGVDVVQQGTNGRAVGQVLFPTIVSRTGGASQLLCVSVKSGRFVPGRVVIGAERTKIAELCDMIEFCSRVRWIDTCRLTCECDGVRFR